MKSIVKEMNQIVIPDADEEISMIPFDLDTFKGLSLKQCALAKEMLAGIKHEGGTAYFTSHGKKLKKDDTLRRGGPHIDGNYGVTQVPDHIVWKNNGGWKVDQDGPAIDTKFHKDSYLSDKGGIILASNYSSCLGWVGEYKGVIKSGGDCSDIKLGKGFKLKAGTVYYGNSQFIHESVAVDKDVHRTVVRITMPEDHSYGNV
jgi:hypothetical protein